MISEKILKDEIKQTKKEAKIRIKEGNWDEVCRLNHVIETLVFVRDWNEE